MSNLFRIIITFILVHLCLGSCTSANRESYSFSELPAQDILQDLTDTLLADGFDFPVGNSDGKGSYVSKTDGKTYKSWYIATSFAEKYFLGIHPGIDLNGTGGGNTDLGQPVFSIASGEVITASDFGAPWGNIVRVKHRYLENGQIKTCYSVYAHLEQLQVKKGDFVKKRAILGEIGTGGGRYPAHLHLEIRKENMKGYDDDFWPESNAKDQNWVIDHYEDPVKFIRSHRKLISPSKEESMIIAIKHEYMLYYFRKGKLVNKYEIALSQKPVGHKEREGDLKLPEGEYYICEKQKGPFYGNYAEFLGSRILRISYPNIYDAHAGFSKGLINQTERDKIIAAIHSGSIPPKNTKLGGGIVIHGWKGDWTPGKNQNLTWGCISMHNKELEAFYDTVSILTPIIIIP